jgi:tetratricopeptide (TPR) repeat protein
LGPDRPGLGPDRPGLGPDRPRPDRPIIGGDTRPGQGGGGTQWRPDHPIRPGGPDGIRPDRPIIGGGGNNIVNRPQIGDNINSITNINNNNWNNWGVRLGGDYWSHNQNWHDHDWHDHWHDTIHDHHDWYHGCWNGHWNNSWYAPIAYGTAGWGLGAIASNWGYGPSYYNPYYDTAAVASVPAYDYSQPVVINVTSEATGGIATGASGTDVQEPPQQQAAFSQFDTALAAFKAGQYSQALAGIDASLKELPQDPVLHETRALCLYALGRYKEAAATLNSLLASAPGMDWTSMSSLYGNADDYTLQLRKLETHVKNNATDPSAMFVLAYHYLVIGQNDSAVRALQEVVKLQPKDATAQRMLAALAPPEEKAAEAATPAAPPPPAPAPAETPAAPAGPTTDLVGDWVAKDDYATVELSITDDSQFTWRATPKGKAAVEVKGNVAASADQLVLETKEQGNMAGQVKSEGADKFTFAMAGMPPSEPGLAFERVLK